MDFSIKAFDTKNTIASAKAGCVAVAVFENKKLSQAAKAFDQGGEITAALKSGDITGKPGSTLLLRGVAGSSAARVLLVGLGADEPVSEKSFTSAITATLVYLALPPVGRNLADKYTWLPPDFDSVFVLSAAMAGTLVEAMADPFEPDLYRDEYRDRAAHHCRGPIGAVQSAPSRRPDCHRRSP